MAVSVTTQNLVTTSPVGTSTLSMKLRSMRFRLKSHLTKPLIALWCFLRVFGALFIEVR
jgi:hypothetical protein